MFCSSGFKAGPVHFCISIDGRTWTCDQYQKSYYYYESMKKTQDKKIKSSFTSLPSGGEQLVISNTIVRSMARTEMKFICKFHLKRIRGVYDYTLRALRCLAPPGIDGTSVAVSVSINSQDFAYVGQLRISHLTPIAICSIQSGPTSGSTNVTLYNFVKHIHDDARFDNLPKMKSSMMQKKLSMRGTEFC